MRVLLGCTDLFFSARILETARHTGAEVVQVRDDLAAAAARERPDLVLVDLGADALRPVEAIAAIRAGDPEVRLVGFVRHGEVDRIRAARDAGASEVHARGAFTARLPDLLRVDRAGGGPAR
jgi:DNA-binding NarL/FixJ family response regulator